MSIDGRSGDENAPTSNVGGLRGGLQAADRELTEYFTSAIDVSGQSYEFYGAMSGMTDAAAELVETHHRRSLGRWELAHGTLARLDALRWHILRDVYHPYGEPDLRAIALRPSWGGGTFVRLALTSPRAVATYARRHCGELPTPEAVGGWLRAEATRGSEVTGFFRVVRDECEEVRTEALRVYAGLMAARDRERHRERREAEDAVLRGERPSNWRIAS